MKTTKFLKITPEMAADFKSKREASKNPEFSFAYNGEMGFGYKVIAEAKNAVFVHQSSFLDCGGFWMPKGTYEAIMNGSSLKGLKLNYNDTYYRY